MSIMIFMFLCFCGLAVMFYHTLHSQEQAYDALRKEIAALRKELPLPNTASSSSPVQELTDMSSASPRGTDASSDSLDIHLG